MNRKFVCAGCICFAISIIASMVPLASDAAAVQFIWAALPYVAMGTGAALLAGSARKKGGR